MSNYSFQLSKVLPNSKERRCLNLGAFVEEGRNVECKFHKMKLVHVSITRNFEECIVCGYTVFKKRG